jgi:hypothetical protein
MKLFRHSGQESSPADETPLMLAGWTVEIDDLVTLIYLRILEREAEFVDIKKEADNIRKAVPADQFVFVDLRVRARLLWYSKTVNTINVVRDAISGTIAALGVIIAGVSAAHPTSTHGLSWQNWLAIALGVIVAVLGAIAPRVTRVEQLERYRQGMNRIRLEAWRFATKRDRYAKFNDAHEAYDAFVDQIEELDNEAIGTAVSANQGK